MKTDIASDLLVNLQLSPELWMVRLWDSSGDFSIMAAAYRNRHRHEHTHEYIEVICGLFFGRVKLSWTGQEFRLSWRQNRLFRRSIRSLHRFREMQHVEAAAEEIKSICEPR